MLEENIEIARRAWEAATRRPEPDFATITELFDPGHVLVTVTDRLDGKERVGVQGFRDWLEEVEASIGDWSTAVEEVEALDDDRVLIIWVGTIEGKQSGAATKQRAGAVVTVRDRLVRRTEAYSSVQEALETAGRA